MQFSPSLGQKEQARNRNDNEDSKREKRSNANTKAEQNEKFPNTVTGVLIPVF